MSYYKIIKNNEIIDVNNKFFRFLKKRPIPIYCDSNQAEAVQSSDGEKFYTADWMRPAPTQLNLELVRVCLISEDEYNSLKEKLKIEESVVIEEEVEWKATPIKKGVVEQPEETQKIVGIRELYEEIQRLKDELNSLKNK